MPSTLTRILRHLKYRFVLAPLGHGKPVPATAMDQEYKSGAWDHLFGPTEEARHRMLVELIHAQKERIRLLDLGCGGGRLAAMVDATRLDGYLGVDISGEAIARARRLNLPHGNFQLGSFEQWRPSSHYDVITFNECLGYAAVPLKTALDFSKHLAPGGRLIVSHFRWGNHAAIWRRLATAFDFTDTREVAGVDGKIWDIRVLAPRSI